MTLPTPVGQLDRTRGRVVGRDRVDEPGAVVAEQVPAVQAGDGGAAVDVAAGDRAAVVVVVGDDRRRELRLRLALVVVGALDRVPAEVGPLGVAVDDRDLLDRVLADVGDPEPVRGRGRSCSATGCAGRCPRSPGAPSPGSSTGAARRRPGRGRRGASCRAGSRRPGRPRPRRRRRRRRRCRSTARRRARTRGCPPLWFSNGCPISRWSTPSPSTGRPVGVERPGADLGVAVGRR